MASRGPCAARITDVAALAGVSTSTASKALNDTGQLREETRERVRRAAEQLGFTPDSRGRALSSGRSFTVGLITTDSSGRFSIPIMLGAEDALSAGEMALRAVRHPGRPAARAALPALAGVAAGGRDHRHRSADRAARADRRTDPGRLRLQPVDRSGRHLGGRGRPRWRGVDRAAPARRSGGSGSRTSPDPRPISSARDRAAATVETAGDALVGEPMHGEWSERWGRHAVDVLLRTTPDSTRSPAAATRSPAASATASASWAGACPTTSPSPGTTTGR